jgi:transposase-like protein
MAGGWQAWPALGAPLCYPPRDSNTIGGGMVAVCPSPVDCPSCDSNQQSVLSTRRAEDGLSITRQRRCNDCGYRWFTVELMVEAEQVDLISNDFTAGKYHYFVQQRLVRELRGIVWRWSKATYQQSR